MKLSYPEQLYVGFRNDREGLAINCLNSVPLGFIVDANGKHDTVDNWRDQNIPTQVIDNIPQTGFRLESIQRRYMSNNALFRVLDPRGFELEISAENMLALMTVCGVENGVVNGPCYWIINTGRAYLCTDKFGYTDKLIKLRAKKKPFKKKISELELGHTYWLGSDMVELTYLGRVWKHSYCRWNSEIPYSKWEEMCLFVNQHGVYSVQHLDGSTITYREDLGKTTQDIYCDWRLKSFLKADYVYQNTKYFDKREDLTFKMELEENPKHPSYIIHQGSVYNYGGRNKNRIWAYQLRLSESDFMDCVGIIGADHMTYKATLFDTEDDNYRTFNAYMVDNYGNRYVV